MNDPKPIQLEWLELAGDHHLQLVQGNDMIVLRPEHLKALDAFRKANPEPNETHTDSDNQ